MGLGLSGMGRFSEPALLILESLADGAKHGYAMMEDIRRRHGIDLGPGTLYGAIARLEEVEGGIVSGYRVLEEPGQDDRYLAQSLADHRQRFGHPPWLLAGDRGVSSPTNEQLAKDAGVKRIVLPAKGTASDKRKRQERERWFRRGFRFRAGIEGRISMLRRCYELDRCRDHGEDGMGRWVGWGIITANLVTVARTEVKRGTQTTRGAA